VLGYVEEDHRQAVVPGWQHYLSLVKSAAEGA